MKWVVIALLLCILVSYFIFQQGKFRVNNERAGFFLLRGGYRAWWIRYSNGMTWDNKGKRIDLWYFPKFEHCDVRKILKREI